ncbi:MAG: hypothetical protein IJ680_02400, partial [Paludibacteraceae bacterium]|nr:hypothetical protein [Paludibacteraceae bacterium]
RHFKGIIFLLVMASVNVYAQDVYAPMPKYKLAQFEVKGKVQSVTERTGECTEQYGEYRFANNEYTLDAYFFNQSGKLTSVKRSELHDEMKIEKYNYVAGGFSVSYYHYDSEGSLTGSTGPIDYKYAPKNTSDRSYTFYDNGVLKTASYFDYGELYQKYTYNKIGQITEFRRYKEGIATKVFTYTYDGNGRLNSMTRTEAGGVVVGKLTYQYLKYDSFGNWTMCVVFQQEGGSGNRVATYIITRMIEYY